jgi:hypothetical protein
MNTSTGDSGLGAAGGFQTNGAISTRRCLSFVQLVNVRARRDQLYVSQRETRDGLVGAWVKLLHAPERVGVASQ